jgi:hypothetical protein
MTLDDFISCLDLLVMTLDDFSLLFISFSLTLDDFSSCLDLLQMIGKLNKLTGFCCKKTKRSKQELKSSKVKTKRSKQELKSSQVKTKRSKQELKSIF